MTAKKPSRRRTIEDLFEPTASEADFDEFIDEIGDSGSTVEIYRIERTERQHLDVAEFDEVKLDPYGFLRARFGPGKYSLKFKSADRKYQGNKTLVVGSQERRPDSGAVTAAAPAASRRDEFIEEMLLAMIAAQKPPDLGGMMNGLGTVLTAILTGTQKAAAPAGDPVAMFTAVTKAAAEMKGPSKDEDWLDRIGKVVTIVKTLTPDSTPDSAWGVARDIGKAIVERVTFPALAAAPEEVTAAAPAAPGGGAVPTQADWVKTGLAYLKAKAKMKKDAGLYIDFMFENHEEPQWNAILGAVQQGATFEHLLQFDPDIGQDPELTPWFRTLYDGIHSNIFEQVDSGGKTGDTGNPAGNGGAVSTGEPTS